MVLSNKRLKQKLREDGSSSASEDPSLKQQQQARPPRLSKREKRRKTSSLQPKKRKREAEGVPQSDSPEKKKRKKKKKTTTKKKTDRVEEEAAHPSNNEQTQSHSQDCSSSTKVYVGGIPYYSTQDDIQCFFASCGTITQLDCMTFPETGNFRGIAIITFKTEAAAERALVLDGVDMGGLFLKVQPYKASRGPKTSDFSPDIVHGYNRVYLGNLSWDITEDEVRKLFSDCKISNIRFGEDKTTGEFLGYAHVDFSDSLSLAIALKLDQNVVCGRPVRIRCAVPKKSQTIDDGSKGTSGKKRRTCYECGVPGHISSTCPKKADSGPGAEHTQNA